MTTFADVKNNAHKLLSKFQKGAINKDDLYAEGIALTCQFNELYDSLNEAQKAEAEDCEDMQDAGDLLTVIKHFAS
ncbi:hypothetical protein FXO89_23025 [Salmonella enterica]|nr:hypothetical protein [Salmonella enterica]